MIKEIKNCYIVTHGEADNVSYSRYYLVYETEEEAIEDMEQFKKEKYEEYEYSEEEILEIEENSSSEYCEDIDGEWFVRIELGKTVRRID